MMEKWMLLVACLLIQFCRLTFAQTNSSALAPKVCRGTSTAFSHPTNVDALYRQYQDTFSDCTYIDGNVEIVFLTDQTNYDLSFLKDIREITGYLLIFSVYADVIPLTSLNIIRGQTLLYHAGRNYSMFVSNNYLPDSRTPVGLRELQLPSLHEIEAGDVFISSNPYLCYVHTINWTDILPNPNFNVFINLTNTSSERCGHCSDQCPVLGGQRRCWGAGPDMCQTYTLSCSPQCDSRCMGPAPKDCCHRQCAAGCTGPSDADCVACRKFDNAGHCEEMCPPMTIYSSTEYKHIPNPGAKFSYGTLCVDKCPTYLIADHGACVHDCPPDRYSNNSVCVECNGPCPKSCQGNAEDDFITSENIRSFEGCTVIKGAIKIYASTLEGDTNIPPMKVDELRVLETVNKVTDFVQVQLSDPSFTSLRYLRNLRIIQGQHTTQQGFSLEIFATSLKSLDLDSLQEVSNGHIYVNSNTDLCYANDIDWKRLITSRSRLSIRNNRNHSLCEHENRVCSRECSQAGCWGPADTQCLACAYFSLADERCLSSCNALPNIYQSSSVTCSRCHPECDGCTNATDASCLRCNNVKNGPYCVPECPVTKYPDDNGVCQDCHENCQYFGCTGALNSVGHGACNACEIAVYDSNHEVTMCLQPDSDCDTGYFKYLNLPSEYDPMTGNKGCVPCHELCKTCTAEGLSYCTTCKYYRQDERCTTECSVDYFIDAADPSTCQRCHSQCVQCRGPTASDCVKCKYYTIYSDLGIGNQDDEEGGDSEPLTFNCTDKCPKYAQYMYTKETKDGDKITLCVAEDYNVLGRAQIGIIVGTVIGSLIIVSIIIIVIVVCCRQKALAEKKTVERAAQIIGVTELQPLNPSGIQPDNAILRLTKESELRQGIMLGAGAFGTVYRGWWVPENEEVKIPVAIKVLNGDILPTQNNELLEEARIMASVNHKNCVRILAICMTERMMIITQLMRFGCLRDYIRKEQANINSRVLLNWCMQIARGMEYLESRHIVHRDLAARNVLVQRPEHVRITDFGLAKLLSNKQGMYSTTGEKMPIKWLALESIQRREYSHKSDVWSYGVMLWELFMYGETPYTNLAAREIPQLLEKGERLPQPRICTIDVFMLMIKCWVLDANSRPSFKELGDEFEKMATDPSRYLVIEDDDVKHLRNGSMSNYHDLARILSLPNDSGPENIISADEYLTPRSNGVAPAATTSNVTPYRAPSTTSAGPEPRRSSRCRRSWLSPFRRRSSQRYTADPCKQTVLANDSNTQYPRSSAAARGLYAEGPAAGPPADDDDGDDDVWTVNNDSIHPSSSPSRPPQAAEARRNYHSQSAAPTDDDYLVPKHNFAQPMYLDFPADQDGEAGEDHTGESYVDMSSPTHAVSNPEYFGDDLACAPLINGHSQAIGHPRQQPIDNYCNVPPRPGRTDVSRSSPAPAAVNRQVSRV